MNMLSIRFVLALDAVTSLAAGLVLAGAAGPLAGVLGLPVWLLQGAGLMFLPWAVAVGWLAARVAPNRRAVAWVAGLNAIWAVGSTVLLLPGWVAPTALGTAFVLAQAAAVAVFAGLQMLALRRQVPAMA